MNVRSLLFVCHGPLTFRLVIATLIGASAGVLMGSPAAAQTAAAVPQIRSFSDVRSLTGQHLAASGTDYRDGDLITRKQVTELFELLEHAGWEVPEQQSVLNKVLSAGDFIARELLSTPKGRQFMRKIAGYKLGYDRLERMSQLPQGQMSVHDLIHKVPNGHTWIQAMTGTQRGKRLGDRLSNSRQGKDFNEPTGHLYTAKQLLEELQPQFQASFFSSQRAATP